MPPPVTSEVNTIWVQTVKKRSKIGLRKLSAWPDVNEPSFFQDRSMAAFDVENQPLKLATQKMRHPKFVF